MDKENWYQLHSGTVTERKPLRNRKNNLESDEHLEPEENCMISKATGCGLLSLH